VAEELIHQPSEASDPESHEARTFPAGSAVLALAIWFVLARLISRLAVEHAWAAAASMVAGIAGTTLAALAVLIAIGRDVWFAPNVAWRAWAAVRLAAAVPMALQVGAALRAQPSVRVQLAGLFSAAATVTLALIEGMVRAHGLWLARATLALLLVGESIELAWPAAHFMFAPETFWPTLLTHLGRWSEACALVGSALALAWSVRATIRTAGFARMRMFVPLPVFLCLLVSMLATSIPPHSAVAIAEVAFGARFDLI
jgi:hypothetical protein